MVGWLVLHPGNALETCISREWHSLAVRIKHFATAARMTLWVTLLMLLYAVIWLQSGPRDMGWARGWLTDALNPADAPYAITFGDVVIDWHDITDLGTVRVNNLRVAQKGGPVFAIIPRVTLTLDALGFLPRHRALNGIHVDGLRLAVSRDEQGVVRLGAQGVEGTLPLRDLIAFFGNDSDAGEQARGRLPFRSLRLSHAALTFSDAISNSTLVSESFAFRISRIRRNLTGTLTMPFTYRGKAGGIDAELFTQTIGESRVVNARLENIPADMVCLLAGCPADYRFTGLVSGKTTLKQTADEGFSGALALSTKDALVDAPPLFPKTLKLRDGTVEGRFAHDGNRIDIDALALKFTDTTLHLKATAARSGEGWHARGEGNARRLNMKKLYKYWPLVVAPDTRQWVIDHITDGVAETATLKFDLLPEDLNDDTIRDEGLHSVVNARGITVNYIPGFPPVTAMDGVVTFTGKTMHVAATSGRMLNSTIHSAILDCDDLDNPKAPMTTTIKMSAPAADVVTMLKLPPFTFDDGIALDAKTITGTTEATLKLGFDGFSGAPPTSAGDVDFSNVQYDIDATLTNLAQPKLLDGRDISGLNGRIHASNAGVDFDGNVKLEGGTNVALTLKDEGGTTIATAKGTLARSQFKQFGIPEVSQLGDGSIAIDAQVALGKQTAIRRATIDLTPLALNIPEISYSKKAGQAASLALTPSKAPRSFELSIKAPDLNVTGGTLQLNAAMNDLAALTLGRVKTSRNDFALRYQTTASGYDVRLTGARLDHSDAFAAPSEGEGILADFPPIRLTLDLGELVLVENHPIKQLKGTLACDRARCASADLSAKTGSGDLQITITPGPPRRLVVTGSNAGDLLRAMDISDRMFGGTLELKGDYDDKQAPPPFSGRLIVQKFKLKNSEILARIISIGSLSGLMNALTGQGIDFKKLSADVDARAGVFTIKKGQIDSNALGLTANGEINTAKRTLNLKGVVVPANSLNSLFGKIPLIGKLSGEGDALIGFNYSVKGTMADPDVFVNPLSGLTPGFLRGIFTIGDDTKAPERTEAPKPESGEEKTPDIELPKPSDNTPGPKPQAVE